MLPNKIFFDVGPLTTFDPINQLTQHVLKILFTINV